MTKEVRGVLAYFVQTAVFLSVFAACLFLSAGRLEWTPGWIWLGINAAGQIISALIIGAINPALAGDRASLRGKRDFDRVLAGVMALFGPAAVCVVGGLDFRQGWAGDFPPAAQAAGIASAAAGSALVVWAMTVNRFFYGAVRIAKEKGHTTCDRGPYRLVRHPGYLAAILFDLGSPLILDSTWALLPAALTVAAIVIRTGMEDRILRAGLEGYPQYAGRVRSKLLPGIW
jgi:protein-S-isoprenylcysteine O-methyltransferase Ste14